MEIQVRTNKSFIKDLELVAAVGYVDFCRVGLTYGSSRISAMLGDVWSDVGKMKLRKLVDTSLYEALVVSTRVIGLKLKSSSELRMRFMRDLSSES